VNQQQTVPKCLQYFWGKTDSNAEGKQNTRVSALQCIPRKVEK